MKRIIAIALSAVLLISVAVAGTLALVSDEERTVNVYTSGDIDIALIDKNGENLTLFPVVYDLKNPTAAWEKDEATGLWTNLENAQDKYIAVKNEGKNDAYIRVIVAFENPKLPGGDYFVERLTLNDNTVKVEKDSLNNATIGGKNYAIYTYTYDEALKGGETSAPALLQVALNMDTTSAEMATIGETFEVFTCVQAVQYSNINDAESMLNAAFKPITTTVHPWSDIKNVVTVSDKEALVDAVADGGVVILNEDVTLDANETISVPKDKNTTLILNGATISGKGDIAAATAVIKNEGSLTIEGTGKIELVDAVVSPNNGYATDAIMNNGMLVVNGGTIQNNLNGASYAINNNVGATTVVNAGNIINTKGTAIRAYSWDANTASKLVVNGGTITGHYAVILQNLSSTLASKIDVTINGGTFVSNDSNYHLAVYSYCNDGSNVNITLNGGTYCGDVAFGGGNKLKPENVTINKDRCTFFGDVYSYNTTVGDIIETDIDLVTIGTAEELVAFEKAVNAGNSYAGKYIVLTADIDLTGIDWKPIGQTGGYSSSTYFQGVFDGCGHTISNLTITHHEVGSNGGKNYATGMFGFIDAGSAEIKNLNVVSAKVEGHHWTGVIVGYLTGTIENCHVADSTVKCTHKNGDACGDKAGVIVGYVNSGLVKDCSATDCSVSAGRDGGQIAGASKTAYVSGCTATNVTVTATGDCNDGSAGKNIREEVIGRVL